jgi:Zn-finger domain-containing protein
VNNLLRNSVGVAEHPDIMETIEKEIEIIAEYHDKLEVLKHYFPLKNSGSKEVING